MAMELTNDKLKGLMDKVQALFALADPSRNPSEAEAAAAALKAQQLIAKYNLDMEALKTHDEPEPVVTGTYRTGIDKSWKYNLAHIISDNFRCHHFWIGKHTVVFMGYDRDIKVAIMTFKYLFKVCEKGARAQCRKAYKEYGTETGVYPSYTRGFCAGIKEKLDEQCVALMVVTPTEVTEEYNKRTAKMKTFNAAHTGTENFNRSQYSRGKTDGRLAMSSHQIEGRR